MLDETYYIYTGYTNDRIDDTPASLAGKKLGVVDPSNSKATLDAWIAEQGLDTQAIGYPTFDDMYAAYTTGRIDALVSSENIAEGVASIYPAQIVGRRPYYLAVAKGRDDLLANVNSAQEIMNNQDKVFLDSLRSRYSANSAVNDFMSADEHEWTQMHPSITVGYLDDYLPYCSKDANGEPTGLMTDVLTAAIQGLPGNWSPKVEYRCFDDQAELFAAFADGQSYDGSIENVAVNRHNLLQRAYTEEVFPDARVLEYESIDECVGAVEKARRREPSSTACAQALSSSRASGSTACSCPSPTTAASASRRATACCCGCSTAGSASSARTTARTRRTTTPRASSRTRRWT